uniref:Single stranded DNA binding protein 4 n=1 Tax=Sarcophilus harrisii TaxID=9305 RepID=A0A7N4PA67_SARHA
LPPPRPQPRPSLFSRTGSGDMDGLSKNSPNNMAGMSNPPGTPRDDGEMGGTFLNPFQSESYSPSLTMSV